MSKGIASLAKQVANKGRGGDSTLLHIQPEELAGIAALLGDNLTINPETGLPEAFSWKKLLGAIGIGAAAALTGGAAAGMLPAWLGGGSALGGVFQTLGTVGKGIIPKVLATTAASQAVGAASQGKDKQGQQQLSDARKYIEDMNKREYARQRFMSDAYAPVVTQPQQPQAPVEPGGIASTLGMNPFVAPGAVNMAEGGKLEPEEQKAQQIVQDAMDAIRGEGEDPEGALNTYLAYYGKEALQDLYKRMSGEGEEEDSAEGEEEYAPPEGMIKGPGNGMDDMATARMAHGGQKVLLSNDEFIIPADVVSGLGDGSSEAGARKLYAMMDRVRKDRTGTTKQPGKIKDSRVLPA
jgi:hypothetical protein